MNEIQFYDNIPYDPGRHERNTLDIYLPKDQDQAPLLIYFYGGGLEGGCRQDVRALGEYLSARGVAVAAPDYRIYPEARFPEYIQDAARASAFLIRRPEWKNRRIFIGGHSAGAYLSAMLWADKRYLAQEGLDADGIGGYLLFSPQPTTHFNVLRERGEDVRKVVVDEAAPLYFVRESGAPLFLAVAERDMENREQQNRLLVSTLKHFGYKGEVYFRYLKGHDHGSYIVPAFEGDVPELFPEILEYIRGRS